MRDKRQIFHPELAAMRTLICGFFLCISSMLLAQHSSETLPAVKDGKWFLISPSGEIPLPVTYTSVGLFSPAGTAFFSTSGNKYGILDKTGKELIPARYFSVFPLGNGYYQTTSENGTELLLATVDRQEKIPCDSAGLLMPSWIIGLKDSVFFLLNTHAGKQIPLNAGLHILLDQFDYILLEQDSIGQILLDPMGNTISDMNCKEDCLQDLQLGEYFFYYRNQAAGINLAVDGNGVIPLPENAVNVRVSETHLHYQVNGIAYLSDRVTRKKIVAVKAEEIWRFDDNYYEIEGKAGKGLMTKAGKIVVEPVYDFIYDDGFYYHVFRNNLEGLLDKTCNWVVACKYEYIRYDDRFFYTHSAITGDGLISRMTGKEILAPMYDRIQIEKLLIKAWLGNKLSIVELNKDHSVKTRLVLENTISLRRRTYGNDKIDFRLFSLGWYCDTVSVFDSTGMWIATKNLWGLKSTSDSMLITPRYTQPVFIPGAPVSLLKGPKEPSQFARPGDEKFQTWKMIDYRTGKLNLKVKITDLDTTDFLSRNFARYSSLDGEGFLRRDGTWEAVAYIDPTEEEFLRVCYSGEYKLLEKETGESVPIYGQINRGARPEEIKIDKKVYKQMSFDKARWNFLDAHGNALYKDSFSFAKPFYRQTAVVRSTGGWGVLRRDSLVIPMQFAAIERLPEYGDTVFKVQLRSAGKVFMDTLFRPLPLSLGKYEKTRGHLSLYASKRGYHLVGADYKLLAESQANLTLYDYDRFSVRNKKICEIYDETGAMLGEVNVKPIDFLSPDNFTAESKGKLGLLSVNGDTLIPFQYAEIRRAGDYLLAEQKGLTGIYTAEGKLLSEAAGQVLVDSVSGNWVECTAGKLTFRDASGNKTGKVSSDLRFAHFFNGYAFSAQGGYTILSPEGTEMLPGKAYTDVQFLPGGYCALKAANKWWEIYDASWKEVAAEIAGKRSMRVLGDHFLEIQSGGSITLYNLATGRSENGFTAVRGAWSDGYLLVSKDAKSKSWYFVNRNLDNVFQRQFSKVTPFRNGYACVGEPGGWTIIGTSGQPRSLASYGALEQIGDRIFSMDAKPLYGLLGSRGETILEPVYETITLLPDKLIQVIKDGRIGYFDYAGKVIYGIR